MLKKKGAEMWSVKFWSAFFLRNNLVLLLKILAPYSPPIRNQKLNCELYKRIFPRSAPAAFTSSRDWLI